MINSYLSPCCLTTCLYFATFKTGKRLEAYTVSGVGVSQPVSGCSRRVQVKSHRTVKARMAELDFQE